MIEAHSDRNRVACEAQLMVSFERWCHEETYQEENIEIKRQNFQMKNLDTIKLL